jgi:hypothetical protein
MPKMTKQFQKSKIGFGLLLFLCFGCSTLQRDLIISRIRLKVIRLELPANDNGAGGIVTADVNRDGYRDFIITQPGFITVYDHYGKNLWSKRINIRVSKRSERFGLPGLHGPGVQAADIDRDQSMEVLFLTNESILYLVRGDNGEVIKTIRLKCPTGAERWEHLVVANFRGEGDRDILLQATNAKGYRMGRYLAAYALDDILKNRIDKPLWERHDFVASAHSGVRIADMDGDGRDEVLGGAILNPEGEILFQIPLRGHIDAIIVSDIRPDIPGLEVVALEEGGRERASDSIDSRGGNHVFLYNRERLIWKSHYMHQEPQNAAVGEFDIDNPGLEIWCRSRYDTTQRPFVINAQAEVISNYEMAIKAPVGWTPKGVEVISPIYWTGNRRQSIAVKERHKHGDIAILDPISGNFLHRIKESADRLYIADVSGDWREELIVLSGNELHIYSNRRKNPDPTHPRLWTYNYYHRSKMTWNYYNP